MNTTQLIDAVTKYFDAARQDLAKVNAFRAAYRELADHIRHGGEHNDDEVLKLLAIAPPGMAEAVEELRAALWIEDIRARNRQPALKELVLRFGEPLPRE